MNVYEITKQWVKEFNYPLFAESTLTSTNDVAKGSASDQLEEFKIYLTDQQTAGRGRNENHWLNAESGGALLSSWSYRLFEPPQHITAPLFGLHLLTAVKETWPQFDWSIKPPNDIYLNDKKVAGLLVETISQGDRFVLIVGLGFNALSHPQKVDFAGHLPETTNLNPYQWYEFLKNLYTQFQKAVKKCVDSSLSNKDQNLLIDALNDFPLKPNNIIDVSPDADITYADNNKVSWVNL